MAADGNAGGKDVPWWLGSGDVGAAVGAMQAGSGLLVGMMAGSILVS
jgi:hypothetical protein